MLHTIIQQITCFDKYYCEYGFTKIVIDENKLNNNVPQGN